jgi:four helix bundle protein
MGVSRFEDLRVWRAAMELCDRVGVLRKRPELRDDEELCSQLNGAALSVPFNISEGFLRRRDKETGQFLRYAFASNGEVRSGYYAARGRSYIDDAELAALTQLNDSIARMLRRWLATLETDNGRRPRTGD